jgi:NAD(P)-dependent dehydrogenase (short-subunit alcohol dehydrogenase family)
LISAATQPNLVTGATGRMRGTGRHVAAELLRRGLAVRAMAHRIDERSEAAALDGIEAAKCQTSGGETPTGTRRSPLLTLRSDTQIQWRNSARQEYVRSASNWTDDRPE